MKIAWLQYDIVWQNPEKNMKILEEMLESSSESWDLLILPEMFDTGFCMNPDEMEGREVEKTIGWMERVARSYKCAVGGSTSVRLDKGTFVNRFVYVDSNQLETYDKIHLFSLSGEHEAYNAGNRIRSIKHSSGLVLRPLICYDLRFPSISLHRGELDLIIYVANWPESRIDHWDSLLKARAIENQCFVLGVNRVGRDGNGLSYNGSSAIYSYDGKTLLGSQNQSGVFVQKIDISGMKEYRKKLPFLIDRRVTAEEN